MLAPAARKLPRALTWSVARPIARDPALALIGALVLLGLAGVLGPLFVTLWSSTRSM